jgi:hypothetical protein
MAAFGLIEFLLINRFVGNLNRAVAIAVSRHNLGNRTRTRLNNGYGNDLAIICEYLGHTYFCTYNGLFHVATSNLKLLLESQPRKAA